MAHRTGSGEETDNRLGDLTHYLGSRYELLILPLVMAFMFFTRYQARENFLREEGFFLAAIDSYYHWRATMYTVENWPNTMPFDPWTAFPDGRYVGQFGTAFDQLIATVALIVGLGDPSEALVHEVVLVMIPLLAALVAIPVYLIGKRLGGRIAGLSGVILLALFPGSFFANTAVGQHQHHVAEVLFMAIAILAFMAALHTAERHKPVFEQVLEKDVEGLRDTIGYSALAGVAVAIYMWMWPPGVLLIGLLGVFFVVYLAIEYTAGRSPEHLAFVGVIAMSVTGILMLGQIEEFSTSPTSFGYLSPLLAFGVAAGCVFMAALARKWETMHVDRLLYPVAILISVIAALALMWLVLPDVYDRLVSEFFRRVTPIQPAATDFTIQEAQPPDDYSDRAFAGFGLAFYTAMIGLIGLIAAPFFGRRAKAEHALIVVWALFLLSMSAAQVRFWYYLALPVAVLNAYLIGHVVTWADVDKGLDSLRDIEGYQIMVLATVVMILIVPLMPPVAGATVVDQGAHQGPHPDTVKWDESLEYLEGSTPEVGDWGGAGNQFEYYGTYPIPEGSHDYPDGSYGVMSWWDYGHMITVNGERIPRTNPFQTAADEASLFLLAESEERASLILDAISTDEDLSQDADALAAALDDYDEDEIEDFRYVMIDDGMATGKFGAITEWSDAEFEDYVGIEEVELDNGETANLQRMNDRYYETTIGSFYANDAANAEQYRLVHESSSQTIIGSVAQETQEGQWETVILNQNLGDLGEQMLQQIQLSPQLQIYDQRIAPEVKTFERVEGATLTGSAEPGEDVFVSVNVNTTNREFMYSQSTTVDETGTFEVTVPYATSNDLGPEDGYTDAEVFTEGDYSVTTWDEEGNISMEGETSVPEPAIYEGEEIDVDLEEVEDDEEDEDETDGEDDEGEEENTETVGVKVR